MRHPIVTLAICFPLVAGFANAQQTAPTLSDQPPASAQPSVPSVESMERDTEGDIRCIVAASILAQQTQDPVQKMTFNAATLYYLGRLDGRTPDLDIGARVYAERARVNSGDILLERARCGQHMIDRGAVLQQIGRDLIARERQESQVQHP
jgi:hypothetical protein